MVVALLNVVAVLLVGVCFLAHRRARRGRPAQRRPRRVSSLALETAATGFAIASIAVAVALKAFA